MVKFVDEDSALVTYVGSLDGGEAPDLREPPAYDEVIEGGDCHYGHYVDEVAVVCGVGTLAGPPPAITTVTPNTGAVSSSVSVMVDGSNFTADSVVEFGGIAMTTTFVSETRLTATLVTGATAGSVPVTVSNSVGESNTVMFAVA